jgi:hypothetical protein
MASEDLDPRAPIVDQETFTLAAELQVRQAIRLQYYVSMLALQADTEGPSPNINWSALHLRIAEIIRGEIRNTDVVSATSTPPHLWVLLVSSYLENLPGIIGRIAAAVNGRAFDSDGGAVRVTLSMGGTCFPTTARSRAELFHQAESLSVEARAEPGNSGHRYLLARPAS